MILRKGTDHGDPCYLLWALDENGKEFRTHVLVRGDRRDAAIGLRRARRALRESIIEDQERTMLEDGRFGEIAL